ncbi:hypothetical protein HY992_02225 [Candidatus Micrarchaeota archaeon]|nr:hypothetical protein [Candidatus Micrarchaeota archaeon]
MTGVLAIRNVDEKTRQFIREYAAEHNLNIGEAVREIVFLVRQHLKECGDHKKKKYQSIFEVYDKIKFSDSDPNLSRNIDKILYGKRD